MTTATATTYVPALGEDAYNDATQLWVVQTPGGSARPARVCGGRDSRSGLTQWFYWVEEGAVLAYRWDIAARQVVRGDPPAAVFTGRHGVTCPEYIFLVDRDIIVDYYKQWRSWRIGEGPMPARPSRGSPDWGMYRLAQWASRQYTDGRRLTYGEAMALSRYPDATLVEEGLCLTITVPSLRIEAIQEDGNHPFRLRGLL